MLYSIVCTYITKVQHITMILVHTAVKLKIYWYIKYSQQTYYNLCCMCTIMYLNEMSRKK